MRGPKRYPYAEVLADPPGQVHRAAHARPCIPTGTTPPVRDDRAVAVGSTAERFGAHVRRGLELATALPEGEQILVIKSWNEWAEGNYLEPDAEVGDARLVALRRELVRAGHLAP